MFNSNKRKGELLGMPYGTANGRLRKNVLFHQLKKHRENYCYVCGGEIESEADLTIEHKQPWQGRDTALFWDMDNIAFSHVGCNVNHVYRGHGPTLDVACKKGHPRTPDNIYIHPRTGKRHCRMCRNEYKMIHR